jgi:hypothetical protein
MILGMSVATFTLLHVGISLVGIIAGLLVVVTMFAARLPSAMTALFLGTTILTDITGYFFPRDHILPSHIVGAISLVILAIALFALYSKKLVGAWRWIFVATSVAALWLNIFVAVAQGFQKIPFLQALAPTGSEPPFIAAQLLVLIAMIALGVLAVRKFHPAGSAPRLRPV